MRDYGSVPKNGKTENKSKSSKWKLMLVSAVLLVGVVLYVTSRNDAPVMGLEKAVESRDMQGFEMAAEQFGFYEDTERGIDELAKKKKAAKKKTKKKAKKKAKKKKSKKKKAKKSTEAPFEDYEENGDYEITMENGDLDAFDGTTKAPKKPAPKKPAPKKPAPKKPAPKKKKRPSERLCDSLAAVPDTFERIAAKLDCENKPNSLACALLQDVEELLAKSFKDNKQIQDLTKYCADKNICELSSELTVFFTKLAGVGDWLENNCVDKFGKILCAGFVAEFKVIYEKLGPVKQALAKCSQGEYDDDFYLMAKKKKKKKPLDRLCGGLQKVAELAQGVGDLDCKSVKDAFICGILDEAGNTKKYKEVAKTFKDFRAYCSDKDICDLEDEVLKGLKNAVDLFSKLGKTTDDKCGELEGLKKKVCQQVARDLKEDIDEAKRLGDGLQKKCKEE